MTDTENSKLMMRLANHRDSIDRLDAILIYTLGERFNHTQAIGRLKADHGLPAADPDREAKQVTRLQHLAKSAGVDPNFAKKIINFIIEEVIRHHIQCKENSQTR